MSKCIKKDCNGDLEFNESKGVYSEYWYCVKCNTDYSVSVELVRDFENMESIENSLNNCQCAIDGTNICKGNC